MSKTVGGTTTRYVYDVAGGMARLLDDGARRTVWGVGLAYTLDDSGGALNVYHTDGLGSVRAQTNSSASVVATWGTDEFGVVDSALTTGTSSQQLQYTGELRDPTTSFVDLRARWYDPGTGRFLSADPLRKSAPGIGGWNRYAYAGDNPTTFIDPTGLAAHGSRVKRTGFQARGLNPGSLLAPLAAAIAAAVGSQLAATSNEVILDSNAVIAATQEGQAADIDTALAGRIPIVPQIVADEASVRTGMGVVTQFIQDRGGQIIPNGSLQVAQLLQQAASLLGRSLGYEDALVAASALSSGVNTILTNDQQFSNFINAVASQVGLNVIHY